MLKKKAPSPKPQTYFELVPVELVVKIAVLDTPVELTPEVAQPAVEPSPPKSSTRTKK